MKSEIQKRSFILSKARKKYMPSQTKSITKALELYLRDDVEKDEQIPLIITKKTRPKNIVDLIGRPKCPECGVDMGLRIINEPKSRTNIHGWKTCWECPVCGHEKYSRRTIQEWLEESKRNLNGR